MKDSRQLAQEIEEKLNVLYVARRKKRRRILQITSVAACFLLVLACLFSLPDLFLSSVHSSPQENSSSEFTAPTPTPFVSSDIPSSTDIPTPTNAPDEEEPDPTDSSSATTKPATTSKSSAKKIKKSSKVKGNIIIDSSLAFSKPKPKSQSTVPPTSEYSGKDGGMSNSGDKGDVETPSLEKPAK